MPIQPINSLDDPRVEDFRNVRDADLVGRRGVFIAEGELVVRALVEGSRFGVKSLFLSEKRAEAMADVIERIGERGPVYVAPQNVMDGVVGFHIHRGVLACGERGAAPDAAALVAGLPRGRARVLALQTLANHDNVGGLFRNAAAFGVGCVLLDSQSCDPLYRKAIRVSMGAALRVPFARVEMAEAIDLLRAHGFVTCALTPGADAEDIDVFAAHNAPERVALLLGAEGPGLTQGVIEAADVRLRIPIATDVDSLNVNVAGAVGLFTLR
jgi:tRNA G18 (ribose-2'-O)-methylase SpoU